MGYGRGFSGDAMKFEDHIKRCVEVLGEGFPEVHKYLDYYFGRFPYFDKHRRKRHHKEGIAEVEKILGHEAAKAAYLHIFDDLMMDNWKPEDGIPENEEDYVKRGLW